MTIGERLLKLRKEKNLSQEDLANVLDVSRQTISKWETDQTTPDFDKIVPLCEYFGITSDELLSGKKDIIKSKDDNRRGNLARNIAISVALYIVSVVSIVISSTVFEAPEIGVGIFFTIIAIATGLIVYSSIYYGDKTRKEKEKKKENKVAKSISDIIDIVGIIVYFFVSFTTGAWHITWIIFLIVGLCRSIIRLLFDLGKKESKEEIKENENE